MGLPPSGPLTPQRSTVVGPRVKSAPAPPTGQRASEGPAMTFRTVGTGGASCCEWIAADGVITIDTPQVFKEFVASLGRNGPTLQESITFNSPGGDFFAALALGREIRRSTRMWTAVGRTEAEPARQAGGAQTYRSSGGGSVAGERCTVADATTLPAVDPASRTTGLWSALSTMESWLRSRRRSTLIILPASAAVAQLFLQNRPDMQNFLLHISQN
jgi:hypothetical protein